MKQRTCTSTPDPGTLKWTYTRSTSIFMSSWWSDCTDL